MLGSEGLSTEIPHRSTQIKTRAVLGFMMPNGRYFSLTTLIKNWQFLTNNGFKLYNNLTSGMRLNFLGIGILCFKTRFKDFDLTVALTTQTEIVIFVRHKQLSKEAALKKNCTQPFMKLCCLNDARSLLRNKIKNGFNQRSSCGYCGNSKCVCARGCMYVCVWVCY